MCVDMGHTKNNHNFRKKFKNLRSDLTLREEDMNDINMVHKILTKMKLKTKLENLIQLNDIPHCPI